MALDRYYARLLRRAWQDTKGFFGWNKKSLVFLILYVVGLFLFWLWQGAEAVKEEIASFIAFGLAPVGAFAILLFIWNCIMAPSRLDRDTQDKHKGEIDLLKTKIQKANDELKRLEEERITRIAVEPYGGRRVWEWEHEHTMWAELRVTNTSSSLSLKDVEVRLVHCVDVLEKQNAPGTYTLYDSQRWNSVGVYWSEGNAPANQFKLSIPPQATRTSLIAYSDNSNGPPAVFNAPIIGNRRPLLVGGVKIEIEVSSPDSPPWRGAFYIECHPNYLGGASATFEFVTWEAWAADHNIVDLF